MLARFSFDLMDLTNAPTVAANWLANGSENEPQHTPKFGTLILHWQTVPEGTRVSREYFDRMKAEELADLARWEAQARHRRLTSDSDWIVQAMAQLAVQGGETAEAGRIQAVVHKFFRDFGQRSEFVEDARVHHGTFCLHWRTGRDAGQGDSAVASAPTASQSATDSIRSADYSSSAARGASRHAH